MTQTLLEVKNLITEFHSGHEKLRAVNDISLQLNRGETIGIVGESGSGKSVTALSVMRLIASPPGKIISGNIIYHHPEKGAVDLLAIPEKEMRTFRGKEIAMIFQEPMTSLNPVFTCGEQVAEAIRLHFSVSKSEAKERVIRLFEKVKLPRPAAIYDTYPHQISGGQKQRVMISMAISCGPSILIADEPTTALDVTVQAAIIDLLKEIQEETKMGILFITHDLGVVANLADRALVMYKGNIVEQGNIHDIFSNPQHPYTKGLLSCRPPLDIRLRALPTIPDFMVENADGSFKATNFSINDLVEKLTVTKDESAARKKKLYAQEPVLSVQNLKTWFPVKSGIFSKTKEYIKAVDDVSFDVYPGETLGLVGESGCGKTTLGRTIIRLINPTEGKIIFRGQEIHSMEQDKLRPLRKHIQIIFQDPYSSLNPRLTIGSAIIEPMQVHRLYANDKERKEKVFDLLRKVNLKESHYDRYPHEFSGGQRQRICIARALALNPEFIICDESVSALDVSIQAQVLNLLNQLKQELGFTYIFISHDLSVVRFMSDRIAVMNQGKIEEMDDADEIYHHPKTDYTKKLISSIPKSFPSDFLSLTSHSR